MLLPVAKVLYSRGANVLLLGLTLAEKQVEESNLPQLKLKELIEETDKTALKIGSDLVAKMQTHPDIPKESSEVYIGLSVQELIEKHGEQEALKIFSEFGRGAFFQQKLAKRIINQTSPKAIVCTNSPRLEKALIIEATQQGIPAFCVIDNCDESEIKDRLCYPGYANKLFVPFSKTKQMLIKYGRPSSQIVVSGNPAFDQFLDKYNHLSKYQDHIDLKEFIGGKKVITLALSVYEPFQVYENKILDALIKHFPESSNYIVLVKPHPNQVQTVNDDKLPKNFLVANSPLEQVLRHTHTLVHLNSTTGFQAHLIGCHTIQARLLENEHYFSQASIGVGLEAKSIHHLLEMLDESLKLPKNECQTRQTASAVIAENINLVIHKGLR